MNINHICIVIPANNEEELLPRCLHSIFRATLMLPDCVSTDIILCVDSSTDATKEIGQKIIGYGGIVVEIEQGNVGYARRYGTEIALLRYPGSLESCWLANTDADCEVPLNWLSEQLHWAEQGIEGITGIVKVDSYAEHEEQVPELFQNQYTIHADGSHPHVHGANMGLRADVYQKAGGWNTLRTAEDHDLWNRLKAMQRHITAKASLYVTTSGRKQGRAPQGFAGKLASYNGIHYGKF